MRPSGRRPIIRGRIPQFRTNNKYTPNAQCRYTIRSVAVGMPPGARATYKSREVSHCFWSSSSYLLSFFSFPFGRLVSGPHVLAFNQMGGRDGTTRRRRQQLGTRRKKKRNKWERAPNRRGIEWRFLFGTISHKVHLSPSHLYMQRRPLAADGGRD